jgi:hypothetical protein
MVIEIVCSDKEITIAQLSSYIDIISEAVKKGYKHYRLSMCKCSEIVNIIEAYGLTSIESQVVNLTINMGETNGTHKAKNKTATIDKSGKIYSRVAR